MGEKSTDTSIVVNLFDWAWRASCLSFVLDQLSVEVSQ